MFESYPVDLEVLFNGTFRQVDQAYTDLVTMHETVTGIIHESMDLVADSTDQEIYRQVQAHLGKLEAHMAKIAAKLALDTAYSQDSRLVQQADRLLHLIRNALRQIEKMLYSVMNQNNNKLHH